MLVVGALADNALEVWETAIELGYSPISVVFDGQKTLEGVETFSIHQLPAALKKLPAVRAGSRGYKDLAGLRLDIKWKTLLVRHVRDVEELGIRNWATLVHPTAHVSPSAKLGQGVFIGPLVSISSGAEIGRFTSVGRNSTVGHHATVGEFCHIAPGVVIPGRVEIGSGVTVGPGAVFLNYLRIGPDSLIGAGSVVTRSVKPGKQAQGNPARTYRSPKTVIIKGFTRFAKWLLKKVGLFDAVKKRLRPS